MGRIVYSDESTSRSRSSRLTTIEPGKAMAAMRLARLTTGP